ncbi:MAG: hypothetical protein IT438_00585 [Phycisphaerales bacterium]|nr:hypothetical protein [Phycisphaerales bacterium]
MTIGLLAVLEWPARFQVAGRWLPLLGLGLLAVGQFMSAMVADRLFPGADRRLTGVLELAPWAVLAAIVIGGLV